MSALVDPLPVWLMEALESGRLDEEQARAIFRYREGAVVFALLWQNKKLAEQQSRLADESHQTPSTPSGMRPLSGDGGRSDVYVVPLGDAADPMVRADPARGVGLGRAARRRERLERRLDDLIERDWQEAHGKRLANRLRKHRANIFPFLDEPAVPYENNAAERAMRPVVRMGKNRRKTDAFCASWLAKCRPLSA